MCQADERDPERTPDAGSFLVEIAGVSATEFEGIARVGKVDVDENKPLAERYAIGSIPTLLFFGTARSSIAFRARCRRANSLEG